MCFTGGRRGQRVQLTVSSMGYVGERVIFTERARLMFTSRLIRSFLSPIFHDDNKRIRRADEVAPDDGSMLDIIVGISWNRRIVD